MHANLHLTDILFGCWHRRLSFPFSPKPGRARPAAAQQTGTYVVCLKCGKEFPFDWQELRIVPQQARSAYTSHVVEARGHI